MSQLSLAELARRHSLVAREELAERRDIGKVQAVGNLADAERRCAQQERRLDHKHTVDIIDHSAAGHLTHDARQVGGRDVQRRGVERDVVMLDKMPRQEADEADEELLDTLRHLPVDDGAVLPVTQVEQEHGIEHTQDVGLARMFHVEVVGNLAHTVHETLGDIGRQRDFRLVELDDGQVGDTDEVAHDGCPDGDLFVGNEADAAIVMRGRDDGNRHAGRIDVEVVGEKRQFVAVIDQREPALDDEREGVAGEESVRLVGAEGHCGIAPGAIELAVPIGRGQFAVGDAPPFGKVVHISGFMG